MQTREESNMPAEKTKPNHGRFRKGISGNPSGRPPGSRNRSSLLIESLLDDEAEQLGRKVIELAKAGNIAALRLCVERLSPVGPDRRVVFDLPPVRNLDDVSSGMACIAAAVSEGQLTPQEGETISRTLERHANVMVYLDLERRVERLERGPAENDNKVEIVKAYKF